MFTLKSEPQDKLSIIKQGFHFYKHIFWRALPYSLLAAISIFIPQLFIDIQPPFTMANLVHNIPFIMSAGVCWLVGFVLISALIFRLYCISYQIPLTFWSSITHVLFKLIPLLLLGSLYVLMVISGTLFLIIPGIILAVSLQFSFILFITDNQNVLQTLLTSHRLVWGHWWHTLFVMSFPLLLDLAVSLGVLLALITLFTQYHTELLTLYQIVCVTNIFVQAVFIPLIFCIALTLLNDLRCRQAAPLPRW